MSPRANRTAAGPSRRVCPMEPVVSSFAASADADRADQCDRHPVGLNHLSQKLHRQVLLGSKLPQSLFDRYAQMDALFSASRISPLAFACCNVLTVVAAVTRDNAQGLLTCSLGTNPDYCCPTDTDTCCSNATLVFPYKPGGFMGTLDGTGHLWTPAPLAGTASATATTGSKTGNPTASTGGPTGAHSNPTTAPASHTGTVIGLAVGIPLGVIAIVAIVTAVLFLRRTGKNSEHQGRRAGAGQYPSGHANPHAGVWAMRELDGDGARAQLGNEGAMHEMPVGGHKKPDDWTTWLSKNR